MPQLPLFDTEDPSPPQAARLAPKLRTLAEQGIRFGTSSWKYEGWLGSIYDPARYMTRGKVSTKKFEADCLCEYARTFPTVCGDFAFYQFPTTESWARLFAETPSTLSFAFKVPEHITVSQWPSHARYGGRAGGPNGDFFNVSLFEELFLSRLRPYADRTATLIFEFGTFSKSTFATPLAFQVRLERFLAVLPGGFRYSVEIRNPEYLTSAYLSMLSSYGVAHVFNAWTRMPDLGAQSELPGAFTADFIVTRALLTKGRAYESAVNAFQPYSKIQVPDLGARAGLVQIARHSRSTGKPAFLFVNNRLEGNAPSTIEAVADVLLEA